MAFGLFKKNKNKNEEEVKENVEEKEDKKASKKKNAKKSKKKKKKSWMPEFFDESVLENSLVELKENERFAFETDEGMVYVALFADSEDFGGFNRKSKKDEDIGQIIEQIQSGDIKCIMMSELMEDGKFIIIPDVDSVDVSMQFSNLRDISYNLVFITDDMSMDVKDETTDLEDIKNFLNSDDNIITFLNNHGFDYEIEEEEEEEEINEEFSDEDFSDDEIPFSDDIDDSSYDITDDNNEVDDNEVYNEDLEEIPYENSNESYDIEEDFDDEDIEDALGFLEDNIDEEDITEEENNIAIKDILLSTDLDLSLSDAPFSEVFENIDSLPLFPEDRESGWIHDYLNEYSRLNNSDLKALRADDMGSLKRSYFTLASAMAKEIEKKYDLDGDNEFAESFRKLKDIRDSKRDGIDSEVERQKDDHRKFFDKEVQKVREAAANEAESKYRQRNDKAFLDECRDLRSDLLLEIETEYNKEFKELDRKRKELANKEFEASVSEIISNLMEDHSKNVESEKRAYDIYSKKLKEFIDDNREDEIKRINAIAKANEMDNRVARNYEEYQEKLNTLVAESNATRERLEKEKDEALKNKDLYINTKINQFKEELDRVRNENENLINKNNQLYEDSKTMRSEIKQEVRESYESRIIAKDNDIKILNERLNDVIEMTERNDKKVSYGRIATTIFAIISALALGGIASHFITLRGVNNRMEETYRQELNQRLDEVEKNYEEKEKALQDTIDQKNNENNQLKQQVEQNKK